MVGLDETAVRTADCTAEVDGTADGTADGTTGPVDKLGIIRFLVPRTFDGKELSDPVGKFVRITVMPGPDGLGVVWSTSASKRTNK